MPTIVTTNITVPAVKAWVDAHGLEAKDYATQVEVHADGSATVLKRRRDVDGKVYTLDGVTLAADPVTIPADPPFPLR